MWHTWRPEMKGSDLDGVDCFFFSKRTHSLDAISSRLDESPSKSLFCGSLGVLDFDYQHHPTFPTTIEFRITQGTVHSWLPMCLWAQIS